MEAIAHLLPQPEIATNSFAQYQLGDSGNVGSFKNGLGQGVGHVFISRAHYRRIAASLERADRAALHSITSSARASSVGGTSMPSAFAVVRLIARSNLVGCSTGMSAGFAPRKILSTNSPARRNRSV